MTVRAFFDGLAEPRNPGGYACGGWVIEAGDEIPEAVVGGRFYRSGEGATNNLSEYEAALDCLRAIYKTGYRGPVVLHGDSQLVVRQYEGAWACNAPHLQELLGKLRHAATFFESVELVWVPREQNALADEQSRLVYRRVTGRDVPERRRKRERESSEPQAPDERPTGVQTSPCLDSGQPKPVIQMISDASKALRIARDGETAWFPKLIGDAKRRRPEGNWTGKERVDDLRGTLLHRAADWIVLCADPACRHMASLSPEIGEQEARDYLQQKGWREVAGHYLCRTHANGKGDE